MRIWEQEPIPLLASPALLPLAVLARTDSPETLLSQIADEIDKIEAREQQQNLSTCVEVLARLKFDRELVQRYLREDLMRESPLYQEIIEEGMQLGKVDTAVRLFSRRVGTIPSEIQTQIQQLPINQLDALTEALLDFTQLENLTTWLQAQQQGHN